MTVFKSMNPLKKATRNDLANLCEALWGWKPCADWIEEQKYHKCLHQDPRCHHQRAERLQLFFDFYGEITAYYVPEFSSSLPPAFNSHGDLIAIIQYIKKNADKPRVQLTLEHFGISGQPRVSPSPSPSSDQNRAFDLAARVITTFECTIEGQADSQLEAGLHPAIWPSDRTFNQFVDSCIPKQSQLRVGPYNDIAQQPQLHLGSLTVKRLKRIAKLTIVRTDDLGSHLLLDRKNGTVAIYHHTSVLKEHLMMAQTQHHTPGPSTSQHSNLPKDLVQETMYTLKHVLFPVDPESRSLLQSLITKDKFDPDLRNDIDTSWQQHEAPMVYEHWGLRLMDLYDEIQTPTPRGYLERWMERKSGSRYVMMATLAGVLIAIMLGVLSLAVSIFQAWVGWQQWQHPVSS
ncbi:uncharacterized protein F4812DRAFT_424828 [Daldinia caldariorum]|uniref:uncharacterized protein n=1 Tax=Daldinia caldariorum TaxID=326644 RepID=UPI00200768FA|nr:uncharacterized protein F4812DRAFT_424828 [Daldinia caldariorum]KAI1468823.1 hypothetical protein F4812DRAFT_424828 [Daldinia caldariorum]